MIVNCRWRCYGGLTRWQCTIPATVITDLAVMVVWSGDCLADIALLRAEPGVVVQLASDPTVFRMSDAVADVAGLDHVTAERPGRIRPVTLPAFTGAGIVG